MYRRLIAFLDAVDNGRLRTSHDDGTSLPARVKRLNHQPSDAKDKLDLFERAVALCWDDFLGVAQDVVLNALPARHLVEKAFAARAQYEASGRVIVFPDAHPGPWTGHVHALEREAGLSADGDVVRYCVFPDEKGLFRVQAVPVPNTPGFENRGGLKAEWRGVRDDDLVKVSGIDGATFCHATGFIGGNKTMEGAIKMAVASL